MTSMVPLQTQGGLKGETIEATVVKHNGTTRVNLVYEGRSYEHVLHFELDLHRVVVLRGGGLFSVAHGITFDAHPTLCLDSTIGDGDNAFKAIIIFDDDEDVPIVPGELVTVSKGYVWVRREGRLWAFPTLTFSMNAGGMELESDHNEEQLRGLSLQAVRTMVPVAGLNPPPPPAPEPRRLPEPVVSAFNVWLKDEIVGELVTTIMEVGVHIHLMCPDFVIMEWPANRCIALAHLAYNDDNTDVRLELEGVEKREGWCLAVTSKGEGEGEGETMRFPLRSPL